MYATFNRFEIQLTLNDHETRNGREAIYVIMGVSK